VFHGFVQLNANSRILVGEAFLPKLPSAVLRLNRTLGPQLSTRCKMKSIKLSFVVLIAALGIQTWAQEQNKHQRHYKFVDLGTLGGPHSYGSPNGDGFGLLNNFGVVASSADTDLPDPNANFFCYVDDCFLVHAARWQGGVITDLG